MQRVLDASALLALVYAEPGAEEVIAALQAGAAMTAINFAETASRLASGGAGEDWLRALPGTLSIALVDVDLDLAVRAALMVPLTRRKGLSLGDRVCLALASRLGVPALTADRAWADLGDELGVTIRLIR